MPRSSKASLFQRLRRVFKKPTLRGPHRTFQLTRRRDYTRETGLPGYIAFTHHVNATLWKYRRVFLPLMGIYALLYVVLVGLVSQETYSVLNDTLRETGDEIFGGDLSAIGKATLLFSSVISISQSEVITQTQQIFLVTTFLLAWLTTIWLLRNLMAGHRVRLRDGLYRSGAPVFATIVILLTVVVQLLPVGLGAIAYAAAHASGLLAGGAPAMLFWIAIGMLGMLSIYWLTSSFIALVVITLPGMYPVKALRTASDLVRGRRVRILLRWLWMAIVLTVTWGVVVIPVILFDGWLKSIWPAIAWVPIVPFTILVMTALTAVWTSSYIYLLYRKVVDYVPSDAS